jgi:small subunit ribosomal protein S13
MPRLLGVEIPGDKRIEASLPYVFGIGRQPEAYFGSCEYRSNIRAKDLYPSS